MYKFIFFIVFLIRFAQIDGQNGTLVHVNTTRGQLFGTHFDFGNDTSQLYYGQADVFEGIPYAQPPVGSLRYSKPQNLTQLPGSLPYNATFLRPVCVQPYASHPISEDCLYLNIYSPNAASGVKYPVMVYIHGGGLITGDNRVGTPGTVRNFVTKEVVVVSIQYRLGFLGFFTTLSDDFPANLGMLDQVLALQFVQTEISNFGGDPTRVTIFGESAGSASVSAHTYSPLSQNLFQQGIQESGAVLTCFEGALGPSYRNFYFAQQACNYTTNQWNSGNYNLLKSCLMNMTIKEGLNNHNIVNGKVRNNVCWNMVQDNYFLPDVPRNLWKKRMSNKPMIIGTNKDEWAMWELQKLAHEWSPTNLTSYTKNYCEQELSNQFANMFGNQSQQILEILENLYFNPGTGDNDNLAWLQFVVDVQTSFAFTAFSAKDVEFHILNNNTNVFLYELAYFVTGDFFPFNIHNVTGWHPTMHVADIPFVFAWSGIGDGPARDANIALANFFSDAWTNFAKTGKPTNDSSWNPAISLYDKMEYMEISANRTMKSGYRTLDQVQFNRILPLYVGELPPSMPDYNNGSVVPTQAPTPIPTKSDYDNSSVVSTQASTPIPTQSNDCPSIMSNGILSCLTILLIQQIFKTF